MTPMIVLTVATMLGLALIGVPIWFYHNDKLDKEELLTILLGELSLLTLVQFVLTVLKVS